jgi:hypothetical protein
MNTITKIIANDGDIQTLWIMCAVFVPSIVGLLLAIVALWLPDDSHALAKQCDDRQHELHHANDHGRHWRHAA